MCSETAVIITAIISPVILAVVTFLIKLEEIKESRHDKRAEEVGDFYEQAAKERDEWREKAYAYREEIVTLKAELQRYINVLKQHGIKINGEAGE